MRWLKNTLNKWASQKQAEELSAFVANLRAMDSHEIGFVVAMATDARHRLEASGHNLIDPIIYTSINPGFSRSLSQAIITLQKNAKSQEAAALMVWLHTMRASIRPELRQLGRNMWGELSRGFSSVEDAAQGLYEITGQHLQVHGSNDFPIGFTPLPA